MDERDDLFRQLADQYRLAPPVAGDNPPVYRDDRPSEMGRAAAQGLTFGGADEAEAWLRSTFGGEDYDAALAEVRSKLREYREARPGEAMLTEMGGAALPAIAGAVATGGGSLAAQFPMLARIGGVLGMGALEGGAYAFNTGEGGFANRLARVPGGAAAGAVGGAAGAAAAYAGGATLRGLTDFARRKMGPRAAGVVEREIRKAVADSNMTMQEAIDGIVNGRILADNETIATIARGWRAQSASADDVLRQGLTGRPDQLRGEMMDFIQSRMGAEGNALRAFKMDDQARRMAAGADYDTVFAAAGQVDDDTAAALADAFRRVPAATKDLDALYRAQTGRAPFFRVTDDGISFDRNPTLEEAEIMRRALSNQASTQFARGAGALGSATGDVERGVRGLLDQSSPDLAAVRGRWSELERASEAFKLGRKALTNPDQAAIDFEMVAEQGDAAIKAYRAGVTAGLRQKASTGSRKSLPRNIYDENTREGQVLRMVFPEDDFPDLENLARNARDAQEANNTILGGSPTAITENRIAEQGVNLAEGAMDVASGGASAMFRLAASAIKSASPQLTPRQAAEAARLVVETDPHVVARALTDTSGMDALYALVERVTGPRGVLGVNAGQNVGAAGGGLLSSSFQPQ